MRKLLFLTLPVVAGSLVFIFLSFSGKVPVGNQASIVEEAFSHNTEFSQSSANLDNCTLEYEIIYPKGCTEDGGVFVRALHRIDLRSVDRVDERSVRDRSRVVFYPKRTTLGRLIAVDHKEVLERCDGVLSEQRPSDIASIMLPANTEGDIKKIIENIIRT